MRSPTEVSDPTARPGPQGVRLWAVVAGFALALAALIVNGAVSSANVLHLVEDGHLVVHTHEILEQLQATHTLLGEASAAHRAYLFTHQERYQEEIGRATARLREKIQSLQEQTADNPAQQERLRELEARSEVWLARIAGHQQLTEGALLGRPLRLPLARWAEQERNGLRARVNALAAAERDLLARRAARSRASSRLTLTTLVLATLLTGVFLASAFYLARRALAQKHQVVASLRRAGRNWRSGSASAPRRWPSPTRGCAARPRTGSGPRAGG